MRPRCLGGRPPAVGVRAPLAAPCAPSRAFARRSPPSSGWPGAVVRDAASSSVRTHGERARAVGAQIAAVGGDSAHALHTKFCVQKIPGQKNTGRGRRGTAPARKTGGNEAQNPLKCHQIAPALTRGGQKEGFPIPNGQQIGRKWAIKCRRAVCPSDRGQTVPRWRRSADNAASSPRKRRQFRPRSPFGTCKICHLGGTHRLESSIRAGTCWESASAPPRAHVSPRRAARAASSPASPLAHGRLLTISDHDTTIPAQKQAIPAPS